MVPGTNSSTTPSAIAYQGFHHWKSPVPYLFAGLALMLGLIALALLILACSFRNATSSGSGENDAQEKPPRTSLPDMEMEPKIVVIMAGDHNPTYLAKPAASSVVRHAEEV